MISLNRKIALRILSRKEWQWKRISSNGFMRRSMIASKCAALVAHDRIASGDIFFRGIPSSYGRAK